MKIAILGGSGAVGRGLAKRWAKAGHEIIIGSRSAERGVSHVEAATQCDIAVLAVPFSHQRAVCEIVGDALAGKVLVDVTVPLVPPKVARVQLPAEGCAALLAQAALGAGVRVVSAFQNVGAAHLQGEGDIDCDVLICGNKVADREVVAGLVKDAGMRGVHAGPLANAAAAEALTSVLIGINKRYNVDGAGIRITGI